MEFCFLLAVSGNIRPHLVVLGKMLIPPKYTFTPQIAELLMSIEASREVIRTFPLDPVVEVNIMRASILKSSLYSAKIEGNPLTLDEITGRTSREQKKLEVFNLLKTLNFIKETGEKPLDVKYLLELHRLVHGAKKGNSAGFRTEAEALYNSAGIAVELFPRPSIIKPLVERLLKFVDSTRERHVPIKAILAHYCLEKIHPFVDGNGRVGRCLLQKILFQGGYGMKGLLSIEEYLNNHRSTYYRMLEEPEKECTDYVEFMLEAISVTAKEAQKLVLSKKVPETEDFLLPRRAEMLRLIKEQRMMNFDQFARRFSAVNPRTLRYDLKKLADAGHIKKLGSTRGVYYCPT